MQSVAICAMAAARMADPYHSSLGGLLAVLLTTVLVSCGPPVKPRQDASAGSASKLQSLQEGVPVLATVLVTHAALPPPPPSGRYLVVIDPWIDVTTGSQVATTKLMQQELVTLAPQHFPQLELLPFTPESLARKPVVLLGAIAPVAGPGSVEPVVGRPGAYRVYGMLADLGSGKIAATDSVWVRPEDIDATPTPFYRDSPVWLPDESVVAYLRTLQARTGDSIDPAYLQNLQAEALITNANTEYGQGEYKPARDLLHRGGRPAGRRTPTTRIRWPLSHQLGARRPAIGHAGLHRTGGLSGGARALVGEIFVPSRLDSLLARPGDQRPVR